MEKASYSTLNCAKSAINILYKKENREIALLGRLFKGPTNQLTLSALTKKLVILMALATGQRLQTLAYINIVDIFLLEEEVKIRVAARLKTSRPGAVQPLLNFLHKEN